MPGMVEMADQVHHMQCKNTGHTTMTCPYRVAPEHGVKQSNSVSSDGILATLRNREQDGRWGHFASIWRVTAQKQPEGHMTLMTGIRPWTDMWNPACASYRLLVLNQQLIGQRDVVC